MKALSTLILLLITSLAQAQDITQVIRGTVTDLDTRASLPGANVILLGSEPLVGATTDLDGNFRIDNVPIGRVSLQISFIGYESTTLTNLELSSGKELIVNVQLEEKIATTEKEVVITATREDNRVLNEMTTVSARTFSIEESQRFAGARNDVGRMAANFAGVRGSDDSVNDIVIRGNSPNGVLWRLEGIDIPNPNHFSDGGSTGGPVSILNNNVLANSDFMSGAFPAEYGNALSGVFDLRMRNGNNEKHEFLGQIGFNGFEFGAEGPISKKSRSSYIVNYRYSTVGAMQAAGLQVGTGAAVPYYQDASFKLNFPTKKAGRFSIFGLGGISSIDFLESERDTTTENFYANAGQDIYVQARMGAIGLNHFKLYNSNTYTRFSIAASGSLNRNVVDSINIADQVTPIGLYRSNFERITYTASFLYNKKITKRHHLKIGSFGKLLAFTLQDSAFNPTFDQFVPITDFDGTTGLIQPYIQWKFKVNDRLTFNSGVHMDYLTLNDSYRIEPRVGARYELAPGKTLSLAYGLHSQTAPLEYYYRQSRLADGTMVEPNLDLDLTGSHHYVLGYDWSFTGNTRLKVETYYQSIFDAVIDASPSSYSLLNRTTFGDPGPDSLVNGGTGVNYGVEFTLEKFMTKGLYYLVTVSLYESKYTGSDGVQRSTAFDGRYVANFVGGKEIALKNRKEDAKSKKKLTFDGKITWAGGQRYTPVDLDASVAAGQTIRPDELAFTEQFRDYFRADVRVALKMVYKKFDQEWAIDVQNVTNRENPLFQQVNLNEGTVATVNQLGLFPMLQWRITF